MKKAYEKSAKQKIAYLFYFRVRTETMGLTAFRLSRHYGLNVNDLIKGLRKFELTATANKESLQQKSKLHQENLETALITKTKK